MSTDHFCELAMQRKLCYRSHGSEDAPAVLLIVGLGLQLTYWPQTLIAGLVERGFRVITLDNRDSGKSFFTDVAPPRSCSSCSVNGLPVITWLIWPKT